VLQIDSNHIKVFCRQKVRFHEKSKQYDFLGAVVSGVLGRKIGSNGEWFDGGMNLYLFARFGDGALCLTAGVYTESLDIKRY
jgi:hypothetical protein